MFLSAILGGSFVSADEETPAAVSFELKPNDRVVFLGAELTEQDIKHNLFEAALSQQWPDRKVSFRNLGWAGDVPTAEARGYFGGAAEGYRRLLEEIDRLKPNVVFVSYGENGCYAGVEGIDDYLKTYTRLIGDLKSRTDRIVIVSPAPAESHPAPLPDVTKLNETRQVMTERLKALADEHKFLYIDLFTPLKERLTSGQNRVTFDTIRFNSAGYELLADAALKQLGVPTIAEKRPDAALLKLIHRKNDLYFHQYRPQNETYLRGFRKHEQGQNATEIAAFDPLIQRVEEQISAQLQGQPIPPEIEIPEPAPLAFKPLTPEEQQKTFKLADGLEISLFAAEPFAANPIQMNFDSKGRLWVASSPIYPQLRPGATPNDSIVILEDTDGDGVADKQTVFAEGLLIPTAILPDERGGAYVANSTELIHIADTDGDGVGDHRQVLLSGFGTEDTHHILHTFRWSPDVLLSFNQSIYIHSHLETPYGVERMLGSGVWRYRKQNARAEQVMFGLVNPWGLIFDKWGQSFATDGAGGEGINYAFPGAAYTSAVGYNRILKGMNPGQPKHCGLEIITGSHFPEEWQDVLVAADFRGNRINRFQLSPQGSGYISRQLDDLLSSSDRAFRPVDMKMAPDGTLFIADWHDSIINHGEVDFRDPRRDDRHGRIWRVSVKGRDRVTPPQLEKWSIDQLVESLKSPEQWTRQMARVQLTLRNADEVATALTNWVQKLDPQDPLFEQRRLEAMWAGQAIGKLSPDLLNAILSSPDHRARAAGVRALSQATQETFGLTAEVPVIPVLEKAVADEHPQVRLEAVNALRAVGTVQATELALRALDQEVDQYLDYALYLTVRATQSQWLPLYEAGKTEMNGNFSKTFFAFKAIDSAAALGPFLKLLDSDQVPADKRDDLLNLIGKFAGKPELKILFDRAMSKPEERTVILNALVSAAQRKAVAPEGDLSALGQLLNETAGLRLIGLWKQSQFQPQLIAIVEDDKQPTPLRHAAIDGLKGLDDKATIERFASDPNLALPFRRLSVIALISLNPEVAATKAVDLLTQANEQQDGEMTEILNAFIGAKDGPEKLAATLKDKKLPPHVATLGVRRAETAGARGNVLVEAFRTSGGLNMVNKSLSPEEMVALISQVEKQGDPKRGELIYRRKELTCMTCHSIGGAGGLAGPDMLSLGASSPVDYIIQSLLEPSAKIKEGYHTVTVATVDGKVINGIVVREGSDDLVLRDAQNKEISIPKGDIDERANSPTSMMPVDLTAKLARDEFVDLVSFLSSLGKDGPFKVSQNRFVRRWHLTNGSELLSYVDGTIRPEDLIDRKVSYTINVTTPGKIGIKTNNNLGLYLTLGEGDQDLLSKEEVTVIDLPVGVHTLHLSAFVHRRTPIAMEIVDVEGSDGRAEVVNR
ncbi:MAG TPA: PVC-type heme-binding CxxCH protein [Planctomicrobium sp.]|nr:PVC-type heme-binding CxxCH protein [Planctomicrobium sp.]